LGERNGGGTEEGQRRRDGGRGWRKEGREKGKREEGEEEEGDIPFEIFCLQGVIKLRQKLFFNLLQGLHVLREGKGTKSLYGLEVRSELAFYIWKLNFYRDFAAIEKDGLVDLEVRGEKGRKGGRRGGEEGKGGGRKGEGKGGRRRGKGEGWGPKSLCGLEVRSETPFYFWQLNFYRHLATIEEDGLVDLGG
jgi:hypothetical protein